MDPGYFFPTTTSVLEAQNHIAQGTYTDQSFVATGPGHPSYDEMIYTAITALKEGNGSTKKAIVRYIERVYSDLPLAHETLLAHQLKRLKDSGKIVLVKKSYKLAGSVTPHEASDPVSQPGSRDRPPKLKPIPVLVSLGLVDEAPALSSEKSGTVPGKRGRGRPPGSKNMKSGPKGVKKGPGRPPKNQTHLVVIPHSSDTIPPTTAGAETVNPGGVKKTVGRPRKNATAGGNQVQLQDLNTDAYGELKKKFDFIQAKVRAAIEVIKPYISNATALSGLAAIQELEGLASMDISAPLKDQTQTNS